MERIMDPAIDLLDKLQIQLEDAWNERRDDTLVDKLAAEHPTLAEDLYEFFGYLVSQTLAADEKRPDLASADQRMRAWLEAEGFVQAAALRDSQRRSATTATTPATPPTMSVLALMKSRTGRLASQLAGGMERMTVQLLTALSDNASVVPERARQELARQAHKSWGISETETLEAMAVTGRAGVRQARVAASRDRPYARKPMSYEAIVKQSDLSDADQEFWLNLAK